jgi:hypothetical protein
MSAAAAATARGLEELMAELAPAREALSQYRALLSAGDALRASAAAPSSAAKRLAALRKQADALAVRAAEAH